MNWGSASHCRAGTPPVQVHVTPRLASRELGSADGSRRVLVDAVLAGPLGQTRLREVRSGGAVVARLTGEDPGSPAFTVSEGGALHPETEEGLHRLLAGVRLVFPDGPG